MFNAAAKSLQSCLTLCDSIDGSPPGSPVPGILQARTLEWVAISFSNAWKWKVKVKMLSRIRLPATPWIAAHQAPPPMGFSRQEYWSGLPLPFPRERQGVKVKKEMWWQKRSWSYVEPRAKACRQPLEAGKTRSGLCHKASEGMQPFWPLLDFSPPELVREWV